MEPSHISAALPAKSDSEGRRSIAGTDLAMVLLLATAAVGALFPQSVINFATRLISRSLVPLARNTARQMQTFGEFDSNTAHAAAYRQIRMQMLSFLLFMRGVIHGPNYTVEVSGIENITTALSKGKGTVLWISDFIFAGDVSKVALSNLGYRVSHLSRPEHGFSETSFGLRFLNPIRTRFELAYLEQRVIHLRQEPKRARSQLMELLGNNRLVSIAANSYEGRRFLEINILRGRFKFAPGAPAIAFQTGAALLPVFVLPSPEPPHFRLVVEPAIKLQDLSQAEAISTAISAYASTLERYIAANPEVWRGWPLMASGAPR